MMGRHSPIPRSCRCSQRLHRDERCCWGPVYSASSSASLLLRLKAPLQWLLVQVLLPMLLLQALLWPAPSVRGSGHGSGLVPLADAPVPGVRSKTSHSVTLQWSDMAGKDHLIWNLLMNRVSVFSGVEHSYEQTGLAPASCYSFQLAYYWKGQWSQFSSPVNVSTTAASEDVDPFAIDAELNQLRKVIERRATAPEVEVAVCELAQLMNPQYVTGSNGAVEYIGNLGPLARAGVQASKKNCLLSQCAQASASTQSIAAGRTGYLRLRAADGVFEQVYTQVPPGSNFVEFAGAGTFRERAVNLLGCRAHNMTFRTANALAVLPGHEEPDERAAQGLRRNCLEVNCTATMMPLYLCEPTDSAAGARDLQEWKHTLNRASQARHTIQKYEVVLKVQASKVIENAELQLYMQPAYREAWIATYLMRLSLSHTSPHFPALLDFFRCSSLPTSLVGAPQSDLAGVLPPFVDGANGVATEEQIGLEEGIGSHFFAGALYETFSTTMQTVVGAYKDFALSHAFVQGIAFQLLHALGVARRVFGFHHNDLLTLSNIRFKQIPAASIAAHRYWCYVLNDEAFESLPDYRESDLTTVSELTFGELLQPDACAAGGAAASNTTSSFCLNADDVDGLRLLLYGFSSSTVVKPELSRWKTGWAFQNTPWDDDTRAVGTIVCEMLAPRVAQWGNAEADAHGAAEADFCAALRNGTFASNALEALRHPYFGTLASLDPQARAASTGSSAAGVTVVDTADAEIFTFLPRPSQTRNASSKGASSRSSLRRSARTAGATVATTARLRRTSKGKVGARTLAPKAHVMKFRQGKASTLIGGSLPTLAAPGSIASAVAGSLSQSASVPVADIGIDTPWIVDKARDSVTIAWPSSAQAALAMVFLNGVSVYTGQGHTWTQNGLSPHSCYRFQVAHFEPEARSWSNASAPLFVNDCSSWKLKMCREHPNCWMGQDGLSTNG
eukprot:INCI4640.1.p1 GENE.INCI4640.1~~INCI4640.1.p1  ORF type:complete len:957 (-),score=141.99 INCI4640.1:134-3004(-)